MNLLIDYLDVIPGGSYLDLGTGNGYAAFAIAGRQPEALVTGIDVAGQAIGKNVELAREANLANVAFKVIDGISLDLPAAAFDGIVCRYALHHLPELPSALREVKGALKERGRLVVADGVMNDDDDGDFINRFQALQPDGHVRFYPRNDLIALVGECGLELLDLAMTTISYSRPFNPDYRALIDETPPAILDAYAIAVHGSEVSARLDILNAAFA